MSFVRSRTKLCLSLDNSSNNVPSHTAHLNRWSDVVPPKTALTFAALWDPQEGMVTFSGAALLETDGPSDTSPHPGVFFDDDDDLSQFADRDTTATNDNTATLATFQDAFKAFLHRTPWNSREHLQTTTKSGSCSGRATPRDYGLHTRASSTLDGLDIYSHDLQLKPRRSLQLSCVDLLDIESSFRTPSAFGKLRLRSDLMLDAHRTESENVSTAAGNKPSYLKSRFSTTTTSSSNYIDVAPNSLQTMRVSGTSAVVAPKWTPSKDPAGSWPFLPRRRRLLRKRRSPSDGDVNAAAASSNSLPNTLRKTSTSASPSPLSPSTTACSSSSPSPCATSSPATTLRKERRGRLRRSGSTSKPVMPMPMPMPMPTLMPTSTSTSPSTATATPPVSPSNSKTPGVKPFRLALFLPKWKMPSRTSRRSRRWAFLDSDSDSDSEGWVCIDITPIIRQRYVATLDEDDEYEC